MVWAVMERNDADIHIECCGLNDLACSGVNFQRKEGRNRKQYNNCGESYFVEY